MQRTMSQLQNPGKRICPFGCCGRKSEATFACRVRDLALRATALALVALGPASVWAETGPLAVALQQQRTFTFEADGVQISNDFAGGAFSDVQRLGPDQYIVTIAPENKPINRSPWYALRMTAQRKKTVSVTLNYAHGRHRYLPKLSRDGRRFAPIADQHIQYDREQGTARLMVQIGPHPLWIAAQELFTSTDYRQWMDQLAKQEAVDVHEIGQSPGGRTLFLLAIGQRMSEPEDAKATGRYVVLFGRQHPPEVSGGVAMRAFVETIADDTELATRFRRAFVVLAVPLINPDGVDRGFWRHNFGGKDLNRDWGPFTQPETRLVRDAIRERIASQNGRVFVGIDFHSTFHNVFYTPSDDAEVELKTFVADWLEAVRERHPNVKLPESASHNPDGTTAKTWFVERFGAPGITYEVADDFDREATRAVARTAAEAMMRRLMAEVRKTESRPVLQR